MGVRREERRPGSGVMRIPCSIPLGQELFDRRFICNPFHLSILQFMYSRQGYHLVKSRAGEFQIVDAFTPCVVAGSDFAMDLDAVEKLAAGLPRKQPQSAKTG